MESEAIPVEELKAPEIGEEGGVDQVMVDLKAHLDFQRSFGEVSGMALEDYEAVFLFMNRECPDTKSKILEVEKQRYNI